MAREREQSDELWRAQLTPEQYRVLRRKGTERPFTGQYVHVDQPGVFACAGCGAELFSSGTKFDSKTGWPSFWDCADPARIDRRRDFSMLLPRTEVLCAACGGHLGHVFNDGPAPTRLRYCINSAALHFQRDAGIPNPPTAGGDSAISDGGRGPEEN